MADTTFTLNTGAKIPALGFGTWQSAPGEVTKAVAHALKSGYRHIDAAYCYGNEDEVGAALKEAFESGLVKREEVFVTTKLWCTYHTRVEEALDISLKSLGLDYVDLYLVHWPVGMNPNGNHPKFPKHADGSRDLQLDRSHIDTYLDVEKLIPTGKARAIGVANYSVKYLELLLPKVNIVPAVNQIENHPQLPQQELVDFCASKGIHVTAYSPLGSTGSPLMSLPVVKEIAAKHGVSEGSVLLSYHIERGLSVLAKSVTPSRIEANRVITKLDAGDLEKLSAIAKEQPQRYVYPDFGVNFGFADKDSGIIIL